MKKIVMLTCLKAETLCTGGGCFSAFYNRSHQFARYGKEEVQIGAFMKCSGCGHYPGKDRGLDEKIQYILAMKPDAVHLGICTCHDGKSRELCDEIKTVCELFEQNGITITRGTHSIF